MFYDPHVPGVLILGEEVAAPRRGVTGRPRHVGHRHKAAQQEGDAEEDMMNPYLLNIILREFPKIF